MREKILDNKGKILHQGKEYEVRAGFVSGSTTNTFDIGYAKKKISVGSFAFDIEKDDEGNPFEGFKSGYVYVTLSFVGATEGAQYELLNINSQGIYSTKVDRIPPKILINGDYGGTFSLGSVVTLPTAMAADVLDPNVEFGLTVTAPNGDVVKDVNGVILTAVDPSQNYSFEINEYGSYNVNYSAKDTAGRTQPFSYVINVPDAEAPVITLTTSYVTTAKVGDTVIMPDFTVADNLSNNVLNYPTDDLSQSNDYDPAKESVFVSRCVITPNGEYIRMKGKQNAIQVLTEGVYIFRIQAHDAAGNIGYFTYTVTVTK